jgi:hypothetical protein
MAFNHRTIYSSLFYVLAIILVILAKPTLIFNEDGLVKQFGIGTEKTIISLGVMNGVLALFSFYVFTMIDIIFTPKNTL